MQIELPIREEEAGDQNSLSHVASANLETTPLFPTSGGIRRRSASDSSVSGMMSRRRSFGREVQHAAEETFLLTRLTVTLLRYLGIGYRWITRYLGLWLYSFLLMPGFIQVGYYYFFSSQVRRSVVYGEHPRSRLDLYLPANAKDGMPVVAFITGGAWIIGYKAWCTFRAKIIRKGNYCCLHRLQKIMILPKNGMRSAYEEGESRINHCFG